MLFATRLSLLLKYMFGCDRIDITGEETFTMTMAMKIILMPWSCIIHIRCSRTGTTPGNCKLTLLPTYMIVSKHLQWQWQWKLFYCHEVASFIFDVQEQEQLLVTANWPYYPHIWLYLNMYNDNDNENYFIAMKFHHSYSMFKNRNNSWQLQIDLTTHIYDCI